MVGTTNNEERAAEPPVIVQASGAVGMVTLNRPSRLNAISPDLARSFVAAMKELERMPDVRAVMVQGNGRAFCAGGDLTHPLFGCDDADERAEMIQEGYGVTRALRESPLPVIVAVHGACAGAGVAIAAAGDIRVAAEDAVFSLDFVRVGVLPDMGTCHLLPRLIGAGRAMELALLAERVDAVEARAMGLIGRIVRGEELGSTAQRLAERVAGMPPRAVQEIKRAVHELPALPLDEAFSREGAALNELVGTEESRNAVRGFLEGRSRDGSPGDGSERP